MRKQSIGRLLKVLAPVSSILSIVGIWGNAVGSIGRVYETDATFYVATAWYFCVATIAVTAAAIGAAGLACYYCEKKLARTIDAPRPETAAESGKRKPGSRALLIGGRTLAVASGAVYCAGIAMVLRAEHTIDLYTLGPILMSAGFMLSMLVLMLHAILQANELVSGHRAVT